MNKGHVKPPRKYYVLSEEGKNVLEQVDMQKAVELDKYKNHDRHAPQCSLDA